MLFLTGRYLSAWTAVALWIAATGLLDAQTTFATLRGTVRDSSGAVIANAAVAVKNVATGALTFHSDEWRGHLQRA